MSNTKNVVKNTTLYLDTSTNICKLSLDGNDYEANLGYSMAEQIFTFIHEKLQENGKDWQDISEIHYFKGPGSFTGLRIGAAVVNALADDLRVPLYDQNGVEQKVIIPDYGRPANISRPVK